MRPQLLRRRPTPPQLAILAAALVVAALVGGTALRPVATEPTASPGRTASPGSTGSPEPPPAAWDELDLDVLVRTATLEPTRTDRAGLLPDTDLVLRSLTHEPAAALAARLTTEPDVELVAAGGSGDVIRLRPATQLAAGVGYRFTLRTDDGAIAGSWAWRVRGPVGVLSTIPGDRTSAVPTNSGIELAFNQDGVASMADHFTIEPAVEGRFARYGTTQVFVPNGLAPSTLYTVTISAGLAGSAPDLALPEPVSFQFETSGPGALQRRTVIGRETLEFGPDATPAMVVLQYGEGEGAPPPDPVDVSVYRLPSLGAAESMLDGWLDQPRWTSYSLPRMDTAGLPLATRFSAPLEPFRGEQYVVRFPASLPPGWYVVELDETPVSQAFLQVTPVAAWVSVMSDRTLAWVNDVTTGGPIAGARASVGDGSPFATSDAEGVAVGPTPEALIPTIARPAGSTTTADDTPILRVTGPSGATLLVPFGVESGDGYRGEWWEQSSPANDRFWSLLVTDRNLYRTDDRIEVWGFLRARDGGAVPASVDVRLVRGGSDRLDRAPAVIASTTEPNATGAFSAELPFTGLPTGGYEVQVVVGGEVIVSSWVSIKIIRKPAYRLEVTSDKAAVIVGTPVTWTVTSAFFEGTPAPEVELSASSGGQDAVLTTDADGVATVTKTAPPAEYPEWADANGWGFYAAPTGPEAGEIWADASVLVFPSAYDLQASGRIVGAALEVSGTLKLVDLEKVERELASGEWSGDAGGAAAGSHPVEIVITELVPVERIVGTAYDFIEKVSRPIIEYSTLRRPIGTTTVATNADGAITASIAIPDPDHQYELRLTAIDPEGRAQLRMAWAGPNVDATWWWDDGPVFQESGGALAGDTEYKIGEPISWQIADGGEPAPTGGDNRFLYLTAQRGLRSHEASSEATFRHPFGAGDAPGIFVIGVRFTGTTFAPKAATWANVDTDERAIEVAISTDRERYRPGEAAEVTITTRDEAGRPVAADVLLQAVDEKLFAIGAASVPEPLGSLYARVDSGIVRLTATHQVPSRGSAEGEGGDTTGGGSRGDFRDTLEFVRLATDGGGTTTTTIRLSDDLTSWHLSAVAVTAGLQTGIGQRLVPVGLPFFVEVTTADTYLLSDDPTITVRAYGDALQPGDQVEFTIASEELGIEPTTLGGTAFRASTFVLPDLVLGRLTLDVAARATTRTDDAGKPLADRMLQRFEVIESRLTERALVFAVLPSLPSGPNPGGHATYTFADAGRGRWLGSLQALAEPSGVRVDDLIAQIVARRTLIGDFGVEPDRLAPVTRDVLAYPYGWGETAATSGVALLPWGGPDPWLATRVAILAPDAFPPVQMGEILREIIGAAATERDLAIAAVAGLAALGEPVLGDLRELASLDELTVGERIHIALGYALLGDDAAAVEIEQALLRELGERQGRWVRLRAHDSLGGIADATALLGVVAAMVGDPLAADMAAYVDENRSTTTSHRLEMASIAARSVARMPATSASFAYSVAGDREVVQLEPGESFRLELTGPQRQALEVEQLSGSVGVAIAANVPVDPDALHAAGDVSIERTAPGPTIPAGGIVTVQLRVEFEPTATQSDCHDVVELVPSGLAPLEGNWGGASSARISWPSSVAGQVVTFCAVNDPKLGRVIELRYQARVVGQGTYTWEPAVLTLAGGGDVGAFTPRRTIVVGAR